jgi:hypothetical protein
LFSRMDAFRFTRSGRRRTIDLLARRIGLSRDGTRAPMQVRNGWRPHGRLLGHQPVALSKDRRFFVQPTRITSFFGLIVPAALGQSFSFDVPVAYPAQNGSLAVVSADFNGDRKPDGRLRVLRQRPGCRNTRRTCPVRYACPALFRSTRRTD